MDGTTCEALGIEGSKPLSLPGLRFHEWLHQTDSPLALSDTPENSTLDVVPCTSFGPKRYLPLNNSGASKVALAQHRPLLHLTGPLWASASA